VAIVYESIESEICFLCIYYSVHFKNRDKVIIKIQGEIKELQKERKRLNNAISQIKHQEKKKMSIDII